MDMNPPLEILDPFIHVVSEVAVALADRPNETSGQRETRMRLAAGTIMAFRPIDPIEAMFAGRCLMFHELIVESVHGTLSGQENTPRRQLRSSIVAMDKAFGNNLAHLARYRAGRAEIVPDATATTAGEPPARAETDIAERIRRHETPSSGPWHSAPSREPAAADQARPEMPAADPVEFGENASDAGVGPGASASGFGGPAAGNQTRTHAYAGNRQARRLAARLGQARSGG